MSVWRGGRRRSRGRGRRWPPGRSRRRTRLGLREGGTATRWLRRGSGPTGEGQGCRSADNEGVSTRYGLGGTQSAARRCGCPVLSDGLWGLHRRTESILRTVPYPWRVRHEMATWRAELARAGRHCWPWPRGQHNRAMKTLFMVTSGRSDPTRASIPLHLAVNGSLEVGHAVSLVFAGDAAELVKSDVREGLEGIGLPPARDLLSKAREHGVPLHV